MALRVVVFSILEIPHAGYSPILLKGDKVLVQRWSYGYRLFWKGTYRRLCPKPVVSGDWVAYNSPSQVSGVQPDAGEICIGRILACPGDTIWMGAKGLVSEFQNFSNGCVWPLVLPASGNKVKATDWNRRLYDQTVRHYEESYANHAGDSLHAEYFTFGHNYYWVSSGSDENLSDSRTMGFLPEEYILGRVSTVLYSVDKEKKWPCLLKNRILFPVGK
ncbi:MAG: signal peptidase I [Bacteroidaceae bacterium]|nr:signal peptidase I [Bacteroidaceae bacterium]